MHQVRCLRWEVATGAELVDALDAAATTLLAWLRDAHIYQTRGGLRPDWTTRPSNRIGVPSTDGRRLGRYGHIAADEYASVRRGAKWLDLRSARSCGGGVGN